MNPFVILSAAKDLYLLDNRSFAAHRMTILNILISVPYRALLQQMNNMLN